MLHIDGFSLLVGLAAELLMSVLYIFELYLQHTCRAADECTV